MDTGEDSDYYARRAEQSRQQAMKAGSDHVRRVQLELAARYEEQGRRVGELAS